MIGIDSNSNSLRTAVTLRDLSKKGHKKFLTKKTIFQLVDINTIMILLFLIGLLVFLSVFLIRALR